MATKKTKTAATEGFAVIKTGGKQYKVSVGDILQIEKLKGKTEAGEKVIFNDVLFFQNGSDVKIGSPYIDGASVEAKLVGVGKAKKIEVMKYKAKSRYLKVRGHRQPFAKVEITAIK